MNAGGVHQAQSIFQELQLIVGYCLIGFVGGEEVGHHAFEAQRRIAMKAREKRRERLQIRTLAAHTRINLEMNGDGAHISRTGSGFEFIKLPCVPHDRGQFMMQYIFSLSGKRTADDENACVRAKTASLDAFFHAGDAEPLAPARTAAGAQSWSECP